MFGLTPGVMLYYGGITGMVVVAIIAIIVFVSLASGRKKLRRTQRRLLLSTW